MNMRAIFQMRTPKVIVAEIDAIIHRVDIDLLYSDGHAAMRFIAQMPRCHSFFHA